MKSLKKKLYKKVGEKVKIMQRRKFRLLGEKFVDKLAKFDFVFYEQESLERRENWSQTIIRLPMVILFF